MSGKGYFDLQVNGYAGVDFNQDGLTADSLHHACERLQADSVGGILATIITDHLASMEERIRTLVRLRDADPLAAALIAGIHLEGPFISPVDGYRGAHPLDAVRPADVGEAARLVHAGNGLVRLVTLAPEHDEGLRATRYLIEQGIKVSAGHCDPSVEQLDAAIDAGITLFTHLGNGVPMLQHRHDNILQRALSRSDRLWPCFIADGAHIPAFALSNYLKSAGTDRCIVVTDATAAAGMGPGRYRLGRWEVEIGEDLVAWAPDRSHLVGSAVTMARAEQNLLAIQGITAGDVARLTRLNPRAALGLA
jgi:N-acetylglucosamine-6-phosphate deacetylase